jgi:starvation-inducible DNA-binding protein
MGQFKRAVLDSRVQGEVASLLQDCLVNLVDLSLQLKQAHWNVVGKNFRSIHLQLDEILLTTREASDDVAERVVAIGSSADGRARKVAEQSNLRPYEPGFHPVATTVSEVADRVDTTIQGLRRAIERLGELDPISEDLLIGISADLEKHLWMLQSQELE